MRTMERRVQYLNRDNKRAEQTLRKTLDLHIRAEEMLKRKSDDARFKEAWLQEQSEALARLRERNLRAREESKRNVEAQKDRILMNNIFNA